MGLIAREIEGRGIPTLSMSSALSITRAVGAPRTAFLDYPLGHTCGKAHEPALQRALLLDALQAFETLTEPGGVVTLGYEWAEDDDWKDRVMRAEASGSGDAYADDRNERADTPQYQTPRDRELAEAALSAGGCPTCVFLEPDREPERFSAGPEPRR